MLWLLLTTDQSWIKMQIYEQSLTGFQRNFYMAIHDHPLNIGALLHTRIKTTVTTMGTSWFSTPKKATSTKSAWKTLVSVSWDAKDIGGVNVFRLTKGKSTWEAVRFIKEEILFYQNNAWPHTSVVAAVKLNEFGYDLLPNSP